MKSRVRTLNFRRTQQFQLFKELLDRSPWKTALRNIRMEQRRQLLKDIFLTAEELSIPLVGEIQREQETSKAEQEPAGHTEG